MSTTTDTSTGVMAENLRIVATLLDAHPDLPAPYITTTYSGAVQVHWYLTITTENHAQQKRLAQLILRTIGGKWAKDAGSEMNFKQGRIFDPISYIVQVSREAVCRRVVTGTETVTIPAVEAQEAQPERTVEREVVEWICEPVLAEAVSA